MSKIYNYNESNIYAGDSRSDSLDKYLDGIDMMQRSPNVYDDFSLVEVHKNHRNKSEKRDDQYPIEIPRVIRYPQAPETYKKAYFPEHESPIEISQANRRHQTPETQKKAHFPEYESPIEISQANRRHQAPETRKKASFPEHESPIEISHANRRHQGPETHKKAHFAEHEKIVDVERKGKHEVHKERTIDVEADGFIQKSHKNFESYNTYKYKGY